MVDHLDASAAAQWMAFAAMAAAGVVAGSFVNVVIHRVPRGMSIVSPPSACPGCGERVRPRDNVPVISWLLLRGRCRYCGERISVRYPLVELVTAVLFVAAGLRFTDLEQAVFVAAASAVLVSLSAIDLEHRRVPNVIVLPATAVALTWVGISSLLRGDVRPLVGALVGGGGFFLLLLVIALLSPGGMGMGDVKLAAFLGVVTGRFGMEITLVAVFMGFMVGGLAALVMVATGRGGRKTQLPFAPMLCVGTLLALYVGRPVLRLWLGL